MDSGEAANRSMPPGTIIPELVYDDLEAAVLWLCAAFGFTERLRIGNHRSQLVFNGGSMVAIEKPDNRGKKLPSSLRRHKPGEMADHSIMVRIEDVDRHYREALKHGAKIIQPPADYPFGERQYTVEDIGGHIWTFSQSVADIDPVDWGGVWAGGQ